MPNPRLSPTGGRRLALPGRPPRRSTHPRTAAAARLDAGGPGAAID